MFKKSLFAFALLVSTSVSFNNQASAFTSSGTYSKTNTLPGTGSTNTNTGITINDSQMFIVTSYEPGSSQMPVVLKAYDKQGYGAIYIAAFYNNVYYFWDRTKTASNRWVAVSDINAVATLPEALIGDIHDYMYGTVTEIIASAHGAEIHIGVGFGFTPAVRKSEMLSSNRHRHVRTLP